MLTRRNLLQGTVLSALASRWPLESSLLAQSAGATPHFVVFAQIYGAWDVCLAFDPKDRDSRLSTGEKAFDQPYGSEAIRRYGVHDLAPGGAALIPFVDRMTVINGIDMEIDGGHTPLISMSGDTQAAAQGKPFLQATLSERHPYLRTRLIPHLYGSYDGFFLPGPYGQKTVVISSQDAYAVLRSDQASTNLSLLGQSVRAMSGLYQGLDRSRIAQYAKAVEQASELRSKLSEAGGPLSPPDNGRNLGAFIGRLFQAGVLGSFTWSLGEAYAFDTHFNHYALHPLSTVLEEIAAFCKQLQVTPWDEHSSLFDHTTLVITGEFSRTPRLNAAQGKDHNIRSNSVVLLGKHVAGASYGKSGEWKFPGAALEAHAGLPIDFRTGLPKADGERLLMRSVWAGMSDILGADLSKEFGADTKAIEFLKRVS